MSRKQYAFEYSICNCYSPEIFEKQCAALAAQIPGLEGERLLTDVDGSQIQVYKHRLGEIQVLNDYQANEVYIESDFDIEPYFPVDE